MHGRFGTTLLGGTLTFSLALGACSGGGGEPSSPLPQGAGTTAATPVADAPGAPAADGASGVDVPSASASTIAAGTEFRSDVAGVSVRMPDGITGRFDEASGTLAFGDARNTLGGFVFGGSAGGVGTGASRAVRTLLPQLGLEIGQVFEDGVDPDGSATSRFAVVDGAGGELFMHLKVRQGSGGNYVVVLGNSAMNEQSTLDAIVSEMSASAVFAPPAPSASLVELGGVVLQASSSNTDLGASGTSTTGGDESFLITCTDGRYRFEATSRAFLNFGGGSSGSSTETVRHEGRFATLVDFGDNSLITMESTDQGTFVLNVTPSDGVIFLDRTPYRQTGTSEQQCGA